MVEIFLAVYNLDMSAILIDKLSFSATEASRGSIKLVGAGWSAYVDVHSDGPGLNLVHVSFIFKLLHQSLSGIHE